MSDISVYIVLEAKRKKIKINDIWMADLSKETKVQMQTIKQNLHVNK
jgi:hypothetical protein